MPACTHARIQARAHTQPTKQIYSRTQTQTVCRICIRVDTLAEVAQRAPPPPLLGCTTCQGWPNRGYHRPAYRCGGGGSHHTSCGQNASLGKARMHVHEHVCIYIYICIRVCTCTYLVCIHTYMHIELRTYIHTCLHIYIYTYVQTYIHNTSACMHTEVRQHGPANEGRPRKPNPLEPASCKLKARHIEQLVIAGS